MRLWASSSLEIYILMILPHIGRAAKAFETSEPSPVYPRTSIDKSSTAITYYSTHPSIQYHPASDCVFTVIGKWCTARDYPWKHNVYELNTTLGAERRSAALVTNERNNDEGNGARNVVFSLPPGV